MNRKILMNDLVKNKLASFSVLAFFTVAFYVASAFGQTISQI